jgi:polysaccharide deacetylase family protein (PEP-CTERM system associated)
MFTRHGKEVCIAAFALVSALIVTVGALMRPARSEGVDLLCLAVTSLVFSWLLSAAEKAWRNAREVPVPAALVHEYVAVSVVSQRDSSMDAPKRKPFQITNAFSIDLEDYFHTEVASQSVAWEDWEFLPSRLGSTVPRLLDLLDETQNRATVFVLGWVAEKYPNLVRHIADRGHEIACHSYRHRAVFRLDQKTFYEDTRKAKQIIEDSTGKIVSGYRAPCFSITKGTEWAFDVLAELDFVYDSSVNPVHHRFYGNTNSPHSPHYVGNHGLFEIPVAVWRVGGMNLPVGGGAYLRLLPYWYSMAGLRRLNRVERKPGTIYMHPWEIDARQPDLRLPLLSHIRQTWGTSSMETRLRGMLREFRFAPLLEVYSAAMTHVPISGIQTSRNREVVTEALF